MEKRVSNMKDKVLLLSTLKASGKPCAEALLQVRKPWPPLALIVDY